MREQGGSLTNVGSTFTDEVHVLLVHRDKEFLSSMSRMLESCSYKVTAVGLAWSALSILSERKDVDIMLTDIHLPDLDAFELLRLTVNMDLPTILMSTNDYDKMLATRAITNGAFLFLMNPITMETLQYLWQHVMREKLGKTRKIVEKGAVFEITYKNEKCNKLKGKRYVEEDKDALKKMVRARKSSEKDVECWKVKTKTCTDWTDELHAKFLDAVNQLGDGRCYPKEILEVMNVPGLTRMQVASHLQKCRNVYWRRAPTARKSHPSSSQTRITTRKFGSMPLLVAQPNLQESKENYRAPQNYSAPRNNFMADERVENMEQSPHPQPHLVPQPFVSQPFMPDSSVPNMPQIGAMFTSGNRNVMANVNVNEQILFNFSSATTGTDSHGSSSNQKQPLEDFFHFVPDNLDEFVQNFSGLTSFNRNPRPQRSVFDYGRLFSDQLYMAAPSNQTRGQWSAGTSDFGGGQP